MKWPADRIANSSPKSFGMYEKSIPYAAKGADLIHLEVGMPDFDTPQHIKQATIDALNRGEVHYSDFAGLAEFRAAIASKLSSNNGLDYSTDEIVVTNGLTHASFAVLMAAINPGDEVILLEPYYPQHINKIELAGGRVVFAPLDKENDFTFDIDAIESLITDRTRMICLVNPANPTGRVYRRDELQALSKLVIEHDLLLLSDEVYEQIVYDAGEHTCIASLPGMRDRTFTMFAFTKAYAMDGWRMGYLAASKEFIPAILKITMNDVAHVNTFCQAGARAAIEGPQDACVAMLEEDRRRRDMVCRRLNELPGVECTVPEGTIYTFPNISGTGIKSADLADQLLEHTLVVTEAGNFYGASGEGHLRICFGAESYERIEEALDRIGDYLKKVV